ncbi:hypothetical protein N9W21_07600 [Shewanella sp.]|nr:hypothetical protein [Shewanella sp.]
MKELKRTQRAAFIVAKTTAKDQQPLEKLNINVHAAKYYAAKDHRKHMIPPTQRGPQI